MNDRLRYGLRVLMLSAVLLVALALPAAASHSCDDPATTGVVEQCSASDEVDYSLTGATSTGKEVISDNMPLVFGVAVAFVAWNIGRRVLGRV